MYAFNIVKNQYVRLFISLLCFIPTIALSKDILAEPKGEYAAIDVKKSYSSFNILQGKQSGNKGNIAKEIEANPGNFNPSVLIALSAHYINQHDFSKAALYARLGMFRAIVDVKAANDPSLSDVNPILFSVITEASAKLSQKQKAILMQEINNITPQIINIDKNIPRNYDKRWACLHSMRAFTGAKMNFASPQKYQEILKQEYQYYTQAMQKDK